jgi:Fe(3+) dicitrate transport protein
MMAKTTMTKNYYFLLGLALMASVQNLYADLSLPTSNVTRLGAVEVVGNREAFSHVAGSGSVIKQEVLALTNPISVGEALRKVSGVYIRDEDGQGLRPNISIRGIDGNRSVKLLLLEDGLPISLAPYGENSAYYAPSIDNMERLEVLKGSGSILYGPQTVGGVINYITQAPPLTPTTRFKAIHGTNRYTNLQLDYGTTYGNTGILLQSMYKGGDGLRQGTPFGIYDFRAKMVTALNHNQDLTLKAQYFNEDSTISYVGLTQTMYDQNPNQNPAIHDQLLVERMGLSATHTHHDLLSGKLDTSLYAYTTRRDFWRQTYDRVRNNATTYERVSGTGNDNESIFWKNGNNGNNRTYEVVGIEPRYQRGNFQTGLKVHYETEINQRVAGSKGDARTGTLSVDERRSTFATSGYVQNRFELTNKWDVTTGLRLESYRQIRNVLKANADDVMGRTGMITEWIPGIGTTYQLSDDTSLFAGVHRGFATPRFADALSSTGVDQKLEAERSWNYELGTKTLIAGAQVNMTGFVYDYQNQIINAAQSSGFDRTNAGKSLNYGAELEVGKEWALSKETTVFSSLAATYVRATQEQGEFKGNDLPYAPRYYGSATTGIRHNAFETALEWVYMGSMYVDTKNSEAEIANGLEGKIESVSIFNLSGQYSFKHFNVFATVKNLFDTTYIASRRPEGIFPGAPRQIQVGVQVKI